MRRENELLRQELAKISTENEILRATSNTRLLDRPRNSSHDSSRLDEELIYTGPMRYTPTDKLAPFANCDNNHDHHTTFPEPLPHDVGSGPHHLPKSSSSPAYLDSPSASPKLGTIPPSLSQPMTSTSNTNGSQLPPAHSITVAPSTSKNLLTAGATWEYIQAHPLYKEGLVDIADVSERLRGSAECDGRGPSFEESLVKKVIEESAGVRLADGQVKDDMVMG